MTADDGATIRSESLPLRTNESPAIFGRPLDGLGEKDRSFVDHEKQGVNGQRRRIEKGGQMAPAVTGLPWINTTQPG